MKIIFITIAILLSQNAHSLDLETTTAAIFDNPDVPINLSIQANFKLINQITSRYQEREKGKI